MQTEEILIPAWVDGRLQPVEKLEAHLRGLRHQAVSIFVTRGRETLIQRRAAGKYHTPGLWANTCCTHPAWNEDGLTCAHRRLREELGMSGLELRRGPGIEYRADVGGGLIEHEVVEVFVAEAPHDVAITLNPEEVSEVRWVNIAELAEETRRTPDIFTPWARIYLQDHLEAIFGPVDAA